MCRIGAACVHRGEEPSFGGTHGSGTIFFSGCSCRCFFCQNRQISRCGTGRQVTPAELHAAALRLIESGVHNLNFVTADHFWPHVRDLCRRLRHEGHTLPFLYNCSGYQCCDLVDEVSELMDIFVPDLKFMSPDLARECMGDPRYPELALAALRLMVERRGFLDVWDPSGQRVARQGVLVRHLVLPGEVENSLSTLRVLRSEFGRLLPLSLMSQFQPTVACSENARFMRAVTAEEYQRVCGLAEELGFVTVYVQPEFGDLDFFPDFESEEPFGAGRQTCPLPTNGV